MIDLLEESWRERLQGEFSKPYMKELEEFVERERESKNIFPPKLLTFYAFSKTPFNKTRVVIVGQDPYHGQDQAHGLSFSVPPKTPPPPSLKNIFKEMHDDLGIAIPKTGCLTSYAEQGVLLLNSTLTVCENTPKSHYGRGWEQFTDAVIDALIDREEPVIFVLWGRSAKDKCMRIYSRQNTRHKVLEAAHPSPFSAYHGFFGCGHFSQINRYLEEMGQAPIDWRLE